MEGVIKTFKLLGTGHQFAFDEAQIIGLAQTKAGYSLKLCIPMITQLTDISHLTLALKKKKKKKKKIGFIYEENRKFSADDKM